MPKVLMLDFEKCTGCRRCELACAVKHGGATGGAHSRVKVVKFEWEGGNVPVSCQQCLDAPCMAVCPARAISRDDKTGRVTIDYDKCLTCRMCVAICPFGAAGFDAAADKVVKCDLCEGAPACAIVCDAGAIQYVDATTVATEKRKAVSAKSVGVLRDVAPVIGAIREGK
jgi:Fe-S-cluster-containing hydrogenase component 2